MVGHYKMVHCGQSGIHEVRSSLRSRMLPLHQVVDLLTLSQTHHQTILILHPTAIVLLLTRILTWTEVMILIQIEDVALLLNRCFVDITFI